ncbi:MAG: hypothetical protein ABIA74_02465 [bacterium]
MKKNRSILFKSFVFLLFFAAINSLNADYHIIYVEGKIKNDSMHALNLKIYEQLKKFIFIGEENISYPMKLETTNEMTADISYDNFSQIYEEPEQQTRSRSDTRATAFPAGDNHWNLLYKEINKIVTTKKFFYLIIFGNAENVIRKTIEELKNKNKLSQINKYLLKIIYLQPPKNTETVFSEEKNLDDALDSLNLLGRDSEEILQTSPSSPTIKVSDETEKFINSKHVTPINISEIKNDIKGWNKLKLRFQRTYNQSLAIKVVEKIIELINEE